MTLHATIIQKSYNVTIRSRGIELRTTLLSPTHSHLASEIRDSTALGRDILRAPDAASARALLDLGAAGNLTLEDVAAAYQPLSAALSATTASFTTVQQTKLAGIATGATANASDAYLLARANHTGTQGWGTLTGTPTTLSGYAISDAVAIATAQTISGAKTFSAPLALTVQSADPATPAAGTVALYAKKWAERAVPVALSENGIARPLMPSQMRTRSSWVLGAFNQAYGFGVGFSNQTAFGTPTYPLWSSASSYARRNRSGSVSSAAAGNSAGLRWSYTSEAAMPNGSGDGGFFVNFRFGIADASLVSGAITFVGLLNGAITATTPPASLVNAIGVGHGASDTNLQLYYGGSSAQTPIDLGANFPINAPNTDVYELTLHAPAGVTGTVYYRVERINTGHVATGTLSGSTTVLPATTTSLDHIFIRSNGASAAAVKLDIHHLLLEQDK